MNVVENQTSDSHVNDDIWFIIPSLTTNNDFTSLCLRPTDVQIGGQFGKRSRLPVCRSWCNSHVLFIETRCRSQSEVPNRCCLTSTRNRSIAVLLGRSRVQQRNLLSCHDVWQANGHEQIWLVGGHWKGHLRNRILGSKHAKQEPKGRYKGSETFFAGNPLPSGFGWGSRINLHSPTSQHRVVSRVL